MKTRINILNNNHQATLTGISGILFINIPACFSQCKATSMEMIIKGMTTNESFYQFLFYIASILY
jgi:hypothetical protein